MAAVEAQLALINLVAQFIILLVSVTIAVYAIAASLLGKEYRKTLMSLKSKKNQVETDLAEKAKSGEVAKIEDYKKTIAAYDAEESRLKSRINNISIKRVVMYPNIFFGISLVICGISLVYFPFSVEYMLAVEVTLTAIGLTVFSRALMGIQLVCQEIEVE
jgi:hypothetical protein